MYFDIAPLKYNSWDEYQAGVIPLLKDFSSMKFTVNDDLQIHTAGKFAWVAATVKMDGKSAKGEPVNMVLRWTSILEKVNGIWVIQHEQVSVPMAGG
jgi:ketosteroid isomerase-like protein